MLPVVLVDYHRPMIITVEQALHNRQNQHMTFNLEAAETEAHIKALHKEIEIFVRK